MASSNFAAPTPEVNYLGQDGSGQLSSLGGTGIISALISTITSPSSTNLVPYLISIILFGFLVYGATVGNNKSDVPCINPQPFGASFNKKHRQLLAIQTKDNLLAGHKKYPDQIFKLWANHGEITVLPPRFISEVRNDKDFGPQDATKTAHSHIPGFEPFADVDVMLTPIVNKYINKVLGKLTKTLSDETTIALKERLGESAEWREYAINIDLLPVVSRLSTRVFMGPTMCDNEDWLEASSHYTKLIFASMGGELSITPKPLRSIVHHFLPECKNLRASLDVCRNILQPEIDGRKKATEQALKLGEPIPTWDDSIDWFRREFGDIDFATKQIQMSMAAIHTTTDLLSEALVCVTRYPEHVPALREEIIRVVGAEGWKKTALYGLRFMDSFVKEAQRMRPALVSTMQREVLKDHTLSNGHVLKKGSMFMTDTTHMWSDNVDYFEDGNKFDPYRFSDMRGTDKENLSQLASTSETHPGFGHGKHACPGRFFAANEIKILLCHMLLKYDFKLAEGYTMPPPLFIGMQILPDPSAKILFRKREPEIDLDIIEG